jgi:hypothetical protein
MKLPETDHERALIREHNLRIRRESMRLAERAEQACQGSVPPMPRTSDDLLVEGLVTRVPVCDLFTILVEDHRLSVMDAVHGLAIQLTALGYSEEVDHVDSADALGIPAAVLAWVGRSGSGGLPG